MQFQRRSKFGSGTQRPDWTGLLWIGLERERDDYRVSAPPNRGMRAWWFARYSSYEVLCRVGIWSRLWSRLWREFDIGSCVWESVAALFTLRCWIVTWSITPTEHGATECQLWTGQSAAFPIVPHENSPDAPFCTCQSYSGSTTEYYFVLGVMFHSSIPVQTECRVQSTQPRTYHCRINFN